MEFGRVTNINNINTSLPADHASVPKILQGNMATQIKVFSGCPIWADKTWVGHIYPKHAKPKDYLNYYATQFNTIELNGTHYQIPDDVTLTKWKEAVPPHFTFCPKVPQAISHAANPALQIDLLNFFLDKMCLLENNLGTIFLQMPPHFTDKKMDALVSLLDKRTVKTNIAVELRSETWFHNNTNFNSFCNYLYKNNLSIVLTDTLGRRDAVHQRLTNKTAFIRFKAYDLHPTDYTRINEWVTRLQQWITQGIETIYFHMHTADKSLNPQIVHYFILELNKHCGQLLTPPNILDANGRQGILL
jgi:uncharacterized protein YecE (DUF72 family)